MKGKSTLAALVVVPVMALLSGCNDQIRIPRGEVYRPKIDGVEYGLYSNMFQNGYGGSDILEVDNGDVMTTYVGNFRIHPPSISYVERKDGPFGFMRKKMGELSVPARKVVYMQFLIDMNKVLRQKVDDEIREIFFEKNTPIEDVREFKYRYLRMHKSYFEGNRGVLESSGEER